MILLPIYQHLISIQINVRCYKQVILENIIANPIKCSTPEEGHAAFQQATNESYIYNQCNFKFHHNDK